MKNHSSAGIIAILILPAVGLTITTALVEQEARAPSSTRRAPPVVIGDNVYVAWWSNSTSNGNNEVLFRVSTDGGLSFADKISAIQLTQNQRE